MAALRGPDIVGRIPLRRTSKGRRLKYRHDAEHRGYGIVAIYSYGPVGEHEQVVREAARVMRDRFGVDGATTSGGISDWPQDEHRDPANPNNATIETQTIFSIDAHGGPHRRRTKQCAPSGADWHLNYLLDNGADYAADADVDVYFTGPLLDGEEWAEKIAEWTENTPVERFRVRALAQGRYWFLADGDPVAEQGSY